MGSAGMTFINGMPTKIKRGLGFLTEKELKQRKKFQQDFSEILKK